MLRERSIARSSTASTPNAAPRARFRRMASMLAHEIKNPLSGIRGAAQLLEADVSDGDRALTRLICDETDRIVKLVDRMEAFSDERPMSRESVNIHAVLDHVKRCRRPASPGTSASARATIPRCRTCSADRDQLMQVFLNLVKNAAEAIGPDRDRWRDRADHRLPSGCSAAAAGSRHARQPAARILRPRQRAGRRRRRFCPTCSTRS